MTHTLARTESILTQLIFDYSLRVRVKAESSEKDSEQALEGNTATTDPQGEGAQTPNDGGNKTKSSKSFIGKLNNLATIDLNNVINARDLALVREYHPSLRVGYSETL